MDRELSLKPNESQIKRALDRLSEDEALTDALDDRGAKTLLAWGEQLVNGLNLAEMTAEQFENTLQNGVRIIRAVNRTNSQRMDMTDEVFVQQIIEILNIALSLNR